MMFGIPARCYQSWVATHLSNPQYLNLLTFHNKTPMRGRQTHAHKVGKKLFKSANTHRIPQSLHFAIIGIIPNHLMRTRKQRLKKLEEEKKKNRLSCLAKRNKWKQVGHDSVSPLDTVPAPFRCLRVNELALKESFKEPC